MKTLLIALAALTSLAGCDYQPGIDIQYQSPRQPSPVAVQKQPSPPADRPSQNEDDNAYALRMIQNAIHLRQDDHDREASIRVTQALYPKLSRAQAERVVEEWHRQTGSWK